MIVVQLLLFFLFLYQIHCAVIIHIPGNNDASNSRADGGNSSLQYYLCENGSIDDNTILAISSLSSHYIDSGPLCSVQNVYNLTIRSDHSLNTSRIVCKNRALGFFNINGLRIQNLRFDHCGGLIQSPETSKVNNTHIFFSTDEEAVLFISWCINVSIINTTITEQYHGYAILMVNSIGVINIHNTKVTPGFTWTQSNMLGSGIAILYTCKECDTNNTMLSLLKCTFENNSKGNSYDDSPIELLENGADHIPLFGSAGLTLLFIESSPSNVSIESVYFLNNSSPITSGCLVVFYNIEHSVLNIQMSLFINNSFFGTLKQKGGGLGMYILADQQGNVSININNTYFYNNINKYIGAGCCLKITNYLRYAANIIIADSIFIWNNAHYKGSALYIERYNLDSKCYSTISVLIDDVSFQENGRKRREKHILKYIATTSSVEFVGVENVFVKKMKLFYNAHTPIVLVKANLTIGKQLLFSKKYTKESLIMKEGSVLTLYPQAQVDFFQNKYFPSGGWYIVSYNQNYQGCPLIFGNMSRINVSSSTYEHVDSLLYITRPDVCNVDELKTHIVFEPQKINNNTLISSTPTGFCVCALNRSCVNSSTVINTYPGSINLITLRTLCASYTDVSCFTFVKLDIISFCHLSLTNDSMYRRYLNNKCTVFNFGLTLNDCIGTNFSLYLFSYEQNQVASINLIATLYVKECPVGFTQSYSDGYNGSCICDLLLQDNIEYTCNINSRSIHIPANSWLGKVQSHDVTFNQVIGYSSVCPYKYCKNGITDVIMTEKDLLCDSNRTGSLCGQCIDGYSIVLGSDACRVCDSNLWLLIILVYVIAGVVLVAFLFCLKLTISIEVFSAIIFYANMTEVSLRDIMLSRISKGDYHFALGQLDVLYSWLNLELGFETCFYKGMTTTIKTALQFLFPAYLCILVVGIWLISKFSIKFASLTMDASVQVLATLLYLSFSKLVLTIINILVPAKVYTLKAIITVWYADGNVSYWNDVGHIMLLVIALLVSVIYVIPFLLWSTFASFFLKKSKWIKRRRNLVDVFQGQYKDQWTWWFGARLWLFLMSSTMYTIYRGDNPSLIILLNFSFLAPFLLTQVYFKPFKSENANRIDSIILTNLLLVEIVTLHSVDNGITLGSSIVIFLLLLSIALLLLIIIAVQFIAKFKRAKDVIEKIKFSISKKIHISQHQSDVPTTPYKSHMDDSECCLREPLLETF